MHTKEGLQVAVMEALLHFALKFKQIEILQEHHGKASHQRVMKAIVDAVRALGSGMGATVCETGSIMAPKVQLVKGRMRRTSR